MFVQAPEIAILGLITLFGGGVYEAIRPPIPTEVQRFIHYQSPEETNLWLKWQQEGRFRGREPETKIGRDLLLFRDHLRVMLVETANMTEQAFDTRFGTATAPNFCAISKAAIAATFADRYGGSPDDYDLRKHSRCA
jgi:hypothetical protein